MRYDDAKNNRHIRDLQMAVSQPLGDAVQCLVQTLGALTVAFYSSWKLTLVVVCSAPVMYLVMAVLSNQLSKRAQEQSNILQQALKFLMNALRNIETVKCFNGERLELQRYGNKIAWAGRLYKKQANIRSLQLGSMQFFTLSVFVQGFWYASHLIINGERNTGQVITTFWAAMMAVSGVVEFLPQYIVIQKGKVAGARLRLLIAEMSEVSAAVEAAGQQAPAGCEGSIEFCQVGNDLQ